MLTLCICSIVILFMLAIILFRITTKGPKIKPSQRKRENINDI